MPSYPFQFLYVSDATGSPVELFNGARLARNLQRAGECGPYFTNVLANGGCDGYTYQPGAPTALLDALFWVDAGDGVPGRQYAPNRGTGGGLLNAVYGASTAASTDEPTWLGGSERYLYLPGVAGNNATVPDTAVLDITGDIEVMVRVALDDWTPAAAMTLVSKYTAASHGYELFVNTNGTLALIVRLAASDVTGTSTVATGFVDGSTHWVKVSRASASGNVNFYTATDNDGVPGAFNLLGTANVATTAGAIVAGSNNLRIGERPAGTTPAAGKFYRVVIRAAIDATTPTDAADINFTLNTDQNSFVAAAGGTTTINRATTGRKAVAYMGRPLWLFGTDDFLTVADSALMDFALNESLTIIAVQRVHNIAVGAAQAIAAKQTGSAAQGYGLLNGAAATSSVAVHDGAAGTTAATGNKTAGTLHVVAGVRNATTDQLIAYLDGTAGAPVTDTTTVTSINAQPFRIGGFSAGASPLDAEIMAVLVWRRALTAAEILEISNFYRGAPQLAGKCWTTADFSSTASPWYNANIPESAEAHGFLVEEWTGLDGAHHRRASTPTGQNRGGAYYGPQSHDARVMKLNVLLHGSTERGLTYLFHWLENRLLNCCDSTCGTRQMWYRQFCPPSPATAPEDGLVRLERLALAEGPTWEQPPLPDSACYLRRVSFTLTAGDPCGYREPAAVGYGVSVTSGVLTTNVLTSCATFEGDARQTRADFSAAAVAYGAMAPIVYIASSSESTAGVRRGLPVLRIAGYADPNNTGLACSAIFLGELILEGYATSGLEIMADLVQRRVLVRGIGSTAWEDGSRLIGPALRSGAPRWWSFGGCDSGFVVVEPAFTGLETNRVSSSSLQVSTWTTRIEAGARIGCC